MMEKLVSIIIPVYNVQEYLRKCLDSVINQTYKNLEIIIVNDGSTDNSFSICKEYAKKDPRIILLSQENRGLSNARNTGIKKISGNYIYFVDSDDWLRLDAIEESIALAIEYDADCVACTPSKQYDENEQKEKTVIIKKYTGQEFAHLMTKPNGLFCFAWGRLIKRDYTSKISFPEGYTFEDIPVMPKLISSMKTVIHTNQMLYFYRQRIGSLSKSRFSFKATDEMDGYISVVNLGHELNDRRIIKNGIIFFLTKYYYYTFKVILNNLDLKKYKEKYKPYKICFQGELIFKRKTRCQELEKQSLRPLR